MSLSACVEQEMIQHQFMYQYIATYGNDVMGNNENNSQLIQLLCTFNISEKVELVCCQDFMVRHDKADIMLTNHILHAVREGTPRMRIFCVNTLMSSFSGMLILDG